MLPARLDERVDTMVDVFVCVGGRDLNTDSGFAFWNDGVGESNHIHTCVRNSPVSAPPALMLTHSSSYVELPYT